MKQLILAAFALTATLSAFAQGSVLWRSDSGDGVHTYHSWAPSTINPFLSLVGAGPNDTPAGTTPYAAYGMALIGAKGLTGRYGASTTFAQLLFANGANAPESSLVPGGLTTTFRSGGADTGLLVAVLPDTITGLIPDGAAATFEMVAWDNTSGLYPTWTQASAVWELQLIAAGKSGTFTVNAIGGSLNTPPVAMAPSFNLHLFSFPEPSTFALLSLGLAALMIARWRK